MTKNAPSGLDLDDLDDEVRPQDDLFLYANQRWITSVPIPEDRAHYGSAVELMEQAERAVRDIINEVVDAPLGTEERKIGDLFASFMDEERANELGAAPLRGDLEQIASVTSMKEFLQLLGSMDRQGVSGFVDLYVANDPGRPERNLVFVEQGGLSLPDESYYREEGFREIRTALRAHVATMFALLEFSDAEERAQRVVDLETEIAAGHWDNVASREREKTYNLLSWADVESLAPVPVGGVSLNDWISAFEVPEETFVEVVVRQPSFLTHVASLMSDESLASWRDWLTYHVVRDAAAYLSDDFVDANFDFYGRTLTGVPAMRERWKRGVSFVEGAMGEAVGRVYVERHFPPEAKVVMDELVANLLAAYRESITNLEWMSDATRTRALEKLSLFTPKIGYPDKWRDYSTLHVRADDLLGNVRAVAAFEFARQLAKIGAPVDKDEWYMTPQTVNAYYNAGFNEVVFPAAILQPPFFDLDRDAAANYGAIGAVIGHEIGHGFDDQGSKSDGRGQLIDWWTDEDRAAFEARAKVLIDQYDELYPPQTPDAHVNGALTIGENIGDLGGLGIAWKAYLLSLGGADPPVIDGLSGAQRFFLSWAFIWRSQARTEEVRRLLAIDPHSPELFRCNQTVRNIDEFYEAFSVSEGDALWLEPERRVTIW